MAQLPKETVCDTQQIVNMVKAHNKAKELLGQALLAFNFLPNQYIVKSKYRSTYKIASEIEKFLAEQ